jgi:ribosomal protein L16 Arg81 hydroxylase
MDSARSFVPIQSFEDLLYPLHTDDFFREFFGKKPVHLSGDSERFASLLTFDSLNELLACHKSNIPFRVFRGADEQIPKERFLKTNKSWLDQVYMVDVGALNLELSQGATVVINSLEQLHEPVSSLSRILELALCNYIDAVAFASFGGIAAFKTHWDHEEVFIVQVAGRKHWRLFPHVRPHPTDNDIGRFDRPTDKPYWEGDLTAGSVLYIPSGWWHDAIATEGPSVHVSFGSDIPTGLDLAQELIKQLVEYESIRAVLPRHGSAADKVHYLNEFRRTVQEVAARVSLDNFLEYRDSLAPARGRISLPWSAIPTSVEPWTASAALSADSFPLPRSGWVHWAVPRAIPLTKFEGRVRFRAMGYQFEFDGVAEPLITALMQHRKVEMDALRKAHGAEYFESLMLRLVSWGLVSLTPHTVI